MMNDSKIKGYKTQLSILDSDCVVIKSRLTQLNSDLSEKRKQILAIKEKIDAIEKKEPLRLSEHAILRYIERVMDVDLLSIEKEILNDELKSQVNILGSGTYPVRDYHVVVKDNVIITVVI